MPLKNRSRARQIVYLLLALGGLVAFVVFIVPLL